MTALELKRWRSRAGQRIAALIGLSLCLTAAIAPAKKGSNKPLSKEAIFSKVAPASVLIVIPNQGGFSIGSGAIIDPSGLVVTNAHVVESSPGTVQVYLYNPKERSLESNLSAYVKSHTPIIGRVVKRGKGTDLALVRLPALGINYPTVELGDSDALHVGQEVVAIGNPQGLTWTFTSGTVSAIRKDAIQTETPINPGNSGGPLLDMRARVIGLNTFIRKESQGLAFAIPINSVKPFIEMYGNSQETEAPPQPSGPTLSKNPVPLASLSMNQDLSLLRSLNGRRGSKSVEAIINRDIENADAVRQRMVKGELTVAQMLPQALEQYKLMAQHNQEEPMSTARTDFFRQVEKSVEHLKQIFQVSQ